MKRPSRYAFGGVLTFMLLAPCVGMAQHTPGDGIKVVGVDVVPHLFSQELPWRRPPDPEVGALVRLYIRKALAR